MKLITFFEHKKYEYKNLSPDPKEKIELTDSDKNQIDRINKKQKATIFNLGWKEIEATSYVGVIRCRNKTIQILPKLDFKENGMEDKDKQKKQTATQNLLFLLSYTKKLTIKESEIASLTSKRDSFFEVLIYLFAKNLDELLKKGIHRRYEVVEEKTGFLKGKWLITKQLRHHPISKHYFLVAYDEFTEDNLLNQILKFTIQCLLTVSESEGNKRLLRQLAFIFSDVSDKMISSNDCKKFTFTRLIDAYKPVFNLAKLFICDSSIQLSVGKVETFSLLFDMNKLFEEFIAEFIKKERILDNTDYNECEIITQKRGEYLVYKNGIEGAFHLQPDILFVSRNNDKECKLIIDTKYKRLETEKDVTSEDMYQMFAYSQRHNCPKVILLYPQWEKEVKKDYFVKEGNRKILICTVNLNRDLKKEKEELRNELNETLKGKIQD
ncbi:MAG: hypothetical protein ABIF11_04450 [Nitrospirota bacterium]